MMPDIGLIVCFCQDELKDRRCSAESKLPGQLVPCRNDRGLPNHAKNDMVFTPGEK